MDCTKGEWKARRVVENELWIMCGNLVIAQTYIADGSEEANAQLIASAPRMHKTLMAACGTLMALVNSKTIKSTTFGAGERIKEIEEALAKAEGK